MIYTASFIETKLKEYLKLSGKEISEGIAGLRTQREAISELPEDKVMMDAAIILTLIYSVALHHKEAERKLMNESLGYLESEIKNILEKK